MYLLQLLVLVNYNMGSLVGAGVSGTFKAGEVNAVFVDLVLDYPLCGSKKLC